MNVSLFSGLWLGDESNKVQKVKNTENYTSSSHNLKVCLVPLHIVRDFNIVRTLYKPKPSFYTRASNLITKANHLMILQHKLLYFSNLLVSNNPRQQDTDTNIEFLIHISFVQ